MGRRGPKPVKSQAVAGAALALFVEVGVKAATTRAIARRAHTTEASLYRHYRSKEDLAQRVLADCLVQFADSLSRAIEGVAGPRQRLAAFVRGYLEFARRNPLEHAFIVQSHDRGLSSVPADVLRPRRLLVEILSEGNASGEFDVPDPLVTAPFVAGGLGRVVALLESRPGELAAAEAEQHLLASIEQMVGARARPGSRAPGERSPAEGGSP